MTDTAAQPSPFDLLGGSEGIALIVDRFYDLMDSEPAFAELRAMHATDLAPMRGSLAGLPCRLERWAENLVRR